MRPLVIRADATCASFGNSSGILLDTMAIAVGTMLGQCEILAQIGAGGMGEVYRAHDHKLERDVAIKVLPEAFARDPERIARFKREAKLLASLNPSNIAAIYDLEEDKGGHFLVMELVEGETLAELLHQSPDRPAARRSAAHRVADRRGAGTRPRKHRHPSRPQARQRESYA